jgi:DNA-binding Lrp family transcriptional regulator
MKNIQPRLVELFKEGYCTPQIGRIARAIDEPSTTIHYNIKKLEKEGVIRTYKAVFDYKKINEGFCVYVLISLASKQYSDPENIARTLAKQKEVESVDILTGDWELIVKIRVGSQDEYYDFLKKVIAKQEGIRKTKSMISLRHLKTEFVSFP